MNKVTTDVLKEESRAMNQARIDELDERIETRMALLRKLGDGLNLMTEYRITIEQAMMGK